MRRKYLVSFERTNHADHDYGPFDKAISKLNATSFHNVRLVDSSDSADILFAGLRNLMAKEDRLIVCELAPLYSKRVNMPGEEPLKVF
jgi:hypothetical protein